MELKPHQSILLYKVPLQEFSLAGSNGHIFPCAEIKQILRKPKDIEIHFEDNSSRDNVYLQITDKERIKKYPVENIDGLNLFCIKSS